MADKTKAFPTHPLVTRLRPSGSADLTTIVGWIGPADGADRVRVYLDLRFSTYYELLAVDILQTAAVDPDEENGPSIVWVRHATPVELVRSVRVSGDVGFLSGAIQQTHLRQSAGAGAGPLARDNQMLPESGDWSCPVPTLEGACETRNIFCPTSPARCG